VTGQLCYPISYAVYRDTHVPRDLSLGNQPILVRERVMLTGKFANKPTRGQSSCGLDNSKTSQLAGSKFLQIMKLLYLICTLNLTLTLTLSNIGSI